MPIQVSRSNEARGIQGQQVASVPCSPNQPSTKQLRYRRKLLKDRPDRNGTLYTAEDIANAVETAELRLVYLKCNNVQNVFPGARSGHHPPCPNHIDLRNNCAINWLLRVSHQS